MKTKQRKRRQQIRDELIAARLEKIGDRVLLNIGAEPTKTAREEAAKCSAESYKKT